MSVSDVRLFVIELHADLENRLNLRLAAFPCDSVVQFTERLLANANPGEVMCNLLSKYCQPVSEILHATGRAGPSFYLLCLSAIIIREFPLFDRGVNAEDVANIAVAVSCCQLVRQYLDVLAASYLLARQDRTKCHRHTPPAALYLGGLP